MGKFFSPLKVFVAGQIFLLIALVAFPVLGISGADASGNSSAVISTFWGMSWLFGSVRLIVYTVIELFVLGLTGLAFIKGRQTA